MRQHWHFLLSCPDHELLPSVAEQLWLDNGLSKIERYDPARAAGYYINKLVADGAYTHARNLERLEYHGPSDLIQATSESSYVPSRLQGMTTGEYLVLR